MMKAIFPAKVHKSDEPGYWVTFPDEPNCFAAGKTMANALRKASGAMTQHLKAKSEAGLPLPKPSPVEAVKMDGDHVIAVTLLEVTLPGKTERYTVTLPSDLIEQIDEIAPNRSGFLAEAARRELIRLRA